MYIAKPSKDQLVWHDPEIGVIIYYGLEIYRPDLPGAGAGTRMKTDAVRTLFDLKSVNPPKLDPGNCSDAYFLTPKIRKKNCKNLKKPVDNVKCR